jgi:hypothetical protein
VTQLAAKYGLKYGLEKAQAQRDVDALILMKGRQI